MNKLIQFTAALMAVLSLTSCATEVGTGVVTSETPPGVVTSEPLPGVTTEHEEEEDPIMLDKDIIKSTITSSDDGIGI